MPHTSAHEMITRQIARELDRLNSIFPEEDEKTAIIQRIADLKAILDCPQDQKEPTAMSLKEIAVEAIRAWRYR